MVDRLKYLGKTTMIFTFSGLLLLSQQILLLLSVDSYALKHLLPACGPLAPSKAQSVDVLTHSLNKRLLC